MTADEIRKMKADYTKRNIEYLDIRAIEVGQPLPVEPPSQFSKKETATEDERRKSETPELPPVIETNTFDIEKAEVHIEGLQKLLVSYEEKSSVKA